MSDLILERTILQKSHQIYALLISTFVFPTPSLQHLLTRKANKKEFKLHRHNFTSARCTTSRSIVTIK